MPSYLKSELIDKITSREAHVGVVGLGYVGLALAVKLAEVGFHVTGVDVDAQKVCRLNKGKSHIEDVTDAQLAKLVRPSTGILGGNGRFYATTDYGQLEAADTISICVPTPLRDTKEPDISYIVRAVESIQQVGAAGKLIVLESTTYPGTTDEAVLPILQAKGLTVGEDFLLAFSAERIDPGRKDYTLKNTPKVIGGVTPNCMDAASTLYGTFVDQIVPVSSTRTAEMVKLLENTFRAVNIGLINEVAIMCDKLGLNVWEVVNAAATKPYGFMPFYPGPGLGGHCIPVDPHYLSWKMRTLNYTARFIELAAEINDSMPHHVVSKVGDALNERCKSIKGSKILILGVAYKPDVGDMRESPALDIIKLLQQKGACLSYHDPYISNLDHENIPLESQDLDEAALRAADCVVIVTNHSDYNWKFVTQNSSLIVDTRNALKMPSNGRVVTL